MAISSGLSHTCAALGDGAAWCWGNNGSGRLGDGTTIQRLTPVQVVGPAGVGLLTDAVGIQTSESHSCAAKSNGTLWCWGSNAGAQLGNPDYYHQPSPVPVVGMP